MVKHYYKNRNTIIRVGKYLLHKDTKTKMLYKPSKQAIYNSIYEEEIWYISTYIFLINNNIDIEERNDY